jgi:hypothetical protein
MASDTLGRVPDCAPAQTLSQTQTEDADAVADEYEMYTDQSRIMTVSMATTRSSKD